jgi:PhnB protein
MSISGARPNERRIVPFLFVSDGPAAIDYYRRAFGATELYRSMMPGGGGTFSQLKIFDSYIQLAEKSATQEEDGETASPRRRRWARQRSCWRSTWTTWTRPGSAPSMPVAKA